MSGELEVECGQELMARPCNFKHAAEVATGVGKVANKKLNWRQCKT